MTEMTHCPGGDCPFRLHCWRFLAPKDGLSHQFNEPPFQLVDIGASSRESSTGKMFECDHFMNRDRQNISFSVKSK